LDVVELKAHASAAYAGAPRPRRSLLHEIKKSDPGAVRIWTCERSGVAGDRRRLIFTECPLSSRPTIRWCRQGMALKGRLDSFTRRHPNGRNRAQTRCQGQPVRTAGSGGEPTILALVGAALQDRKKETLQPDSGLIGKRKAKPAEPGLTGDHSARPLRSRHLALALTALLRCAGDDRRRVRARGT
jgi:hypothetical protein